MSFCPATCLYSTTRDPPSQPPKSGYGFYCYALDQLENLSAVQKMLERITEARHNGRPGYAPRVMFRAFCLKFLLGVRFVVEFRMVLESSARWREICGMGDDVPSDSTFSRFFKRLSEFEKNEESAIVEMVEKLKAELPDTGRIAAIDGTDIESYADIERTDDDGDPLTDPGGEWGKRTAKGKSNTKEKVEWFFGRKMHLLSDVVYGIPLAAETLPANASEYTWLPKLVEKARRNHKWFKPEILLADKGYDSQEIHEFLYNKGITPIIAIDDPTAHDGLHDGLFDKSGTPVCGDGKAQMKYIETDAQGRHKFTCPPGGCSLKAKSNGSMQYCDDSAIWIDPREHLRTAGVIARASSGWWKHYKGFKGKGGHGGRQTIERTFGSLKQSRLLDRSYYLDDRKIVCHANMSLLTYLATMLTRVRAGDPEKMRHMRIKVG